MGSCPDWYLLLRAARYLGVAPWDLSERPQAWMEWALESENAELSAENERAKRGGR
jgi:hypothetical protein